MIANSKSLSRALRVTVRRLVVLGVLLISACAHVAFPRYREVVDDELRSALLTDLLPPATSAQMVQRAIFEMNGREIDLTLYVRTSLPCSIRLLAVSDLGGTLFDVEQDERGMRWIGGSKNVFDERIIRRLLEDEALAFLPPPREACSLVRLESDAPALRWQSGKTQILAYRGGTGGHYAMEAGEGGRSLSFVRIDWSDPALEGRLSHPASLEIEGRRVSYRASIEVVEWNPVASSGGASGEAP